MKFDTTHWAESKPVRCSWLGQQSVSKDDQKVNFTNGSGLVCLVLA